jgi:hypothetical protein
LRARDQHLVLQRDPSDSDVVMQLLVPADVSPERISRLQLTEAVVETVKAGLE